MKKRSLFIPFMSVCLLVGGSVSARQEKRELTPEQRSEVNAHREPSVKSGATFRTAEERARKVSENQLTVSLRSRLATPPDSSIRVDRDKNSLSNHHPVYHNYTPEELVKKVLLADPRAESAITNVSFTGHNWNGTSWTADDRSLHYFENGQYLGIDSGLILATSPALSAEGPNFNSGEMGGGTSVNTDPDLNKICSAPTSGSVLEFDFVPYASRATFNFIFVSEEYGDYSNDHSVNDAFGFFVSKANSPVDTVNIARFPNDSLVTISNSNWGHKWDESKAYYEANQPDTTGYTAALVWNSSLNGFYVPAGSSIAVNPQWHIPHHTSGSPVMTYDGQTIKLEAVAENLVVGEKYHLKLAICNRGDNALGSAVFLSNLDLGLPTSEVEVPYTGIASIDSLGMDQDNKPVSAGFSRWELMYIGETCDILLYQPFQCCYDTIKIRMASGPLTVQRYVDIPGVPGVITDPPAGKSYVPGFQDFSFTARYTAGEPLSVRATGYYSSTLLDLDKTAELQDDGSCKYTIYKVVEPWTVSFIPKENSGDVATGRVEEQSVWSSGGTLYIKSPQPCVATVYTLTGVLCRQEPVDAQASIRLPRGFYIVSVNNRQYKVVIK